MKRRHGQEERDSQQTYARQRARRAARCRRRASRPLRPTSTPPPPPPRGCPAEGLPVGAGATVPTRPPRAQRTNALELHACRRGSARVHRIHVATGWWQACGGMRTSGGLTHDSRVDLLIDATVSPSHCRPRSRSRPRPFSNLHLTQAAVAARRPPHGVHGRTRGASRFSRWGLAALCGWSKSKSGRNGRAMRRRQ